MMSLRRKKTLCLCALLGSYALFTAASAHADDTPPVFIPGPAAATDPSYLLRYKFVVGTVLNYDTTMDTQSSIPMNGTSMPVSTHTDTTSSQTVANINTDGSGVINTKINGMSATMNGNAIPMASVEQLFAQPIPMTITPTGGLINTDSTAPALQAITGGGLFKYGASLPTQAVRIGDSWRISDPLPQLKTFMSSTMVLKSVQVVDGDNVAEIDAIYSSTPSGANAKTTPAPAGTPSVAGNLTGNAVLLFDLDKGRIESMSTSMNMNITPPTQPGQPSIGTMAVKTSMKMTLTSSQP